MKNQIIPNKELISIMDISDCRMIAGGTWLSYLVGYVLSALMYKVLMKQDTVVHILKVIVDILLSCNYINMFHDRL